MKAKKQSFSTILWYSLLMVLFVFGCSSKSEKKKAPAPSQMTVLMEAYEFGYPLVLMDLKREYSINTESPIKTKAGMNQFSHSTKFPNDQFRTMPHPSVDVLYSTAWLDLSESAQVLEVPDTKGRYYSMPMYDAWSNVYFSPGSRTTGTGARKFLIVGPNWKGETPAGMLLVKSPTNLTWIVGKTQTNGAKDIKNVTKLQKGFKLSPLHKMDRPAVSQNGTSMTGLPKDQIVKMPADEFFNRLNRLMVQNPPSNDDKTVMTKFTKLGIAPGATFEINKLPPVDRDKIVLLSYNMDKKFSEQKMIQGEVNNGWQMTRDLGRYGKNYAKRAQIAYNSLGANLDVDGLYPVAYVDGAGDTLAGDKNYLIHFPKSELPPVNAFWSLTVYDKNELLFKNPINRFALGSKDKLKYNIDGSLDIFMGQNRPSKDWQSNWLPIPKGEFSVMARLYWPQEKALDPKWALPPIMTTTGKEISAK